MQIALSAKNKNYVIEKAVNALKKGGIVVYPSDTVYGMAVDATNPMALQKLDILKKRRPEQKYSYNFADLNMIRKFCSTTHERYRVLKKYLPGPYTFVIADDVSVRIPQNCIITEIVAVFGKPVTATSANITGRSPATNIRNLDPKIYLGVELIIEEPDFKPRKTSTVVDLREKPYQVLRHGALSFPLNK